MVRVQRNILGVAGEYFVAAEMSRRGLIATLTIKNTPQVDCVASKPGSSKAVYLQVKTRTYLKIVDSLNMPRYKPVHAATARRPMGADSGAFS